MRAPKQLSNLTLGSSNSTHQGLQSICPNLGYGTSNSTQFVQGIPKCLFQPSTIRSYDHQLENNQVENPHQHGYPGNKKVRLKPFSIQEQSMPMTIHNPKITWKYHTSKNQQWNHTWNMLPIKKSNYSYWSNYSLVLYYISCFLSPNPMYKVLQE